MDPRHEAEIAAFNDLFGPAYAAWLAAVPVTPRVPWTAVANDDAEIAVPAAANDNQGEAA